MNIATRQKTKIHKNERIYSTAYNKQGDIMKIVEYNHYNDILIEFQDEYRARVKTRYDHFLSGGVNNPYHRSLYGVGMMGTKFKNPHKLEYKTWSSMMCRCYNEKYSQVSHTYKDVACVEEWHLFENFYKWLHNQDNFENLKRESLRFALDKDIFIKGNKIYAPDRCFLVPQAVNNLFIRSEKTRGKYPIGVDFSNGVYRAVCSNGKGKLEQLGKANDVIDAFNLYKNYKEKIIREVANENYKKGLITKACYNAMLNYQVDFDD